jgi:hypothetical protein
MPYVAAALARSVADGTGQPGLIRSLLSEDPKLVNSKDAVRVFHGDSNAEHSPGCYER